MDLDIDSSIIENINNCFPTHLQKYIVDIKNINNYFEVKILIKSKIDEVCFFALINSVFKIEKYFGKDSKGIYFETTNLKSAIVKGYKQFKKFGAKVK